MSADAALRNQDDLSGSTPPLKVPMGLGSLHQWVPGTDADLQTAVRRRCEYFAGAPAALRGVPQVVPDGGPGQEQGAAGIQALGIHRRNRAGGSAEKDQHPPDAQGSQ
jgi:hypothetical protein